MELLESGASNGILDGCGESRAAEVECKQADCLSDSIWANELGIELV